MPEELEFEETEGEEVEAIEVERSKKRVKADKQDPDIYTLYQKYLRGNIILQPEFQRNYVWDDKKASRLIESIFLEIPIPVIYFAEEKDGRWSVIDGQQRLVSIFRFFGPIEVGEQRLNQLKLRGLSILTELEGMTYQDPPEELKRKFENTPIRVIIISKESDSSVKFEIFERLNTGSVKLNDMELRNCIYRGPYNELLKELASNRDFLYLLGLNKPHPRMMDRELVLRFFAFYHTNYQQYKGPMKHFLNREMERYRNISEEERRELREVFLKSVELSKIVFGDKAFRRFELGNANDPNGRWERKINKALFDVVMYGFTLYEKRDIIPKSDAIKEELIWLMTNDREFYEAITKSTDKKENVIKRFDKWLSSLREIVGYPTSEPRTFSYHYKKQLWETDNTCRICGQEIKLLDDAEIDHIEFYWRGGKTIPSNARLVHRYCNRARRQ